MSTISKAARLMNQTGELRPGYVRDDHAHIEGATPPQDFTARPRVKDGSTKSAKGRRRGVHLVFNIEADPITGALRVVQK